MVKTPSFKRLILRAVLRQVDLVQSLNLGPIWQASDSLSPRAPGSARRPFLKFAPEPSKAALGKSQTAWSDQAKPLPQQSLNAGLQAAQNSTAFLFEEAARMNGAAVRQAFEDGVAGMEQALVAGRWIAWLSLAASVVALTAREIWLERLYPLAADCLLEQGCPWLQNFPHFNWRKHANAKRFLDMGGGLRQFVFHRQERITLQCDGVLD